MSAAPVTPGPIEFCSTPADALQGTRTEWGSSRVTEYQRCPQAYHLSYTDGIAPVRKAHYFDTGSFVHGCLRWINEGVIAGLPTGARDWRDVIAAATEAREMAIAAGTAQPVPWDEIDPIGEAERLVSSYYALHGLENGGWPEGVKLLEVERLYSAPSARATGRVDLLVDVGGEIRICDTKTRSRGLPEDRQEFERDQQTVEEFLRLSALVQAARGLPEPPAVWLDALIKTKIPKVDRLLVRFTQRQIDEWWQNARALVELDAAAIGRHLPVVRNYHECAPMFGGSRCWAFDWCHGTDEVRERRYRRVEKQ